MIQKKKERKEKEETKQERKEIERRLESEKIKGSERKNDMKVSKEKREKTKRKESLNAKKSEIKSAFHTNKPMFMLLYKEALLNINDLDSSLPRVVSSLLHEYEYVFPEDDPCGFPPEETKEIQCQVEELISPCVLHILLIPKKDHSWRMCIYFRAINNIMFKIQGRIILRKGGNDENQSTKDPLQILSGPITRARVEKASRCIKWSCEGVYLGQPRILRRAQMKSSL